MRVRVCVYVGVRVCVCVLAPCACVLMHESATAGGEGKNEIVEAILTMHFMHIYTAELAKVAPAGVLVLSQC